MKNTTRTRAACERMIEALLHGATSTQRRTLLFALARAVLRARQRGADKQMCVVIAGALRDRGAFEALYGRES